MAVVIETDNGDASEPLSATVVVCSIIKVRDIYPEKTYPDMILSFLLCFCQSHCNCLDELRARRCTYCPVLKVAGDIEFVLMGHD